MNGGIPMMMGPPPPMMMAPPYSPNHHPSQPRDPAVAMPPLNENELDGIAYSFGWTKLETPPQPPMASYGREQPDGAMSRLNFWLNNSTVGSFVDHPNNNYNDSNSVMTANNNNQHKKGTQLFRRNNISMPEAYAVLENPRLHAGHPRGFQNYPQQRYQQPHQNQHHHQSPNPNSQHQQQQQQQPQPPLKHPRQRRPCRYGLHCHSAICKFQHPPGFVAPSQQQQQQERNSPTKPKRTGGGNGGGGGGRGPCRYGARCSRPDCWFQHPIMMNDTKTCSTATTTSSSTSCTESTTESTKKETSTNSSVTSADAVEEKKELEV
jgi:hypothetical protein